MQATECCDESGTSDHMACQDEELPIHGVSVKSQFECHTNAIVGGLRDTQALVEKQSNPENLMIELIAAVISQTIHFSEFHNNTLFSSRSTNVSPPSVEKYVLNETFLI